MTGIDLLDQLEDLVLASLDPGTARSRHGLPHPLSKFAANGGVNENVYAEAILQFIYDSVLTEPNTGHHNAATWFLFYSEIAFFTACAKAGIDAEKLRAHLSLCRQLGPDER